MNEEQLELMKELAKNGVEIGNFVMDNHGTMTLYSGCGHGRRKRKRKPRRQQPTTADSVAIQPLTEARQQLFQQIIDLISLGEWHLQGGVERVGQMMSRVLGADGMAMSQEERQMSEQLWTLFEHRRGGEALRVTFLNMIGYWDERGLFHHHGGSPSLCRMFFHTDDGYCNIDKGRPGSSSMLPGFKDVLPLLDQYCPKEE